MLAKALSGAPSAEVDSSVCGLLEAVIAALGDAVVKPLRVGDEITIDGCAYRLGPLGWVRCDG